MSFTVHPEHRAGTLPAAAFRTPQNHQGRERDPEMTLSFKDIAKLYRALPEIDKAPSDPEHPHLKHVGDVVYDAEVFTDKEYWDDVYDQIYDNQT
ncbi:hypothetical protein, partial [Streptomyces subrutilus]|uniref:hypothetical protein n=1 Tax=Streptomyces subrutilus TaxID=36818 RepID=UPI00167A216A